MQQPHLKSKILILGVTYYKHRTNMKNKLINSIKSAFCLISLIVMTANCSKKVVDIKSPCASNDGGPCGPRKPVNDWWLKQQKNNHHNHS